MINPAVSGLARARLDQESSNVPSMSTLRFWILSFGVSIGFMLSILDATIIATSLHDISEDFDSPPTLNWVALAYTLSYMAFSVVFSRASDISGRGPALCVANVLFLASSVLCGFAQTFTQLLVFRAFQGVGGSGLYSLTMIILPELSPPQCVQYVSSLIGVVIVVASAIGPTVGGILCRYAGWRWVFWINGPLGMVSLVLVTCFWPDSQFRIQLPYLSWRSLDLGGSTILTVAAVLTVFAFQSAAEDHGNYVWNKPIFLVPIFIGCTCWAAFYFWERAVEKHHNDGGKVIPVFPTALLRNYNFSVCVSNSLLLGFPFVLLVFAVPLKAQQGDGKTALTAGLMLLPMLGTAAVGTAVGGSLNTRKDYFYQTMLIGSGLMAIGCGLLVWSTGENNTKAMLGFLAIAGLGYGLSMAAVTILPAFRVPLEHYAVTQGIISQLRILGGSLGISAISILVRHELTDQLPPTPYPRISHMHSNSTIHDMNHNSTMIHPPAPVSSASSRQDIIKDVYADSFQHSMIISTAVSSLTIIITLLGYYAKLRSERKKAKE